MKNSNSLRRQEHIMKLLARHHSMRITDLIETLEVSGWTIRRDLNQLEGLDLIHRSYGMVELVAKAELRTYLQSLHWQEDHKIMEAKQRIGKHATSLLTNHSQIAMGAGTTTLACARNLKNTDKQITVMTNGLNIALELTGLPNLELICTGGTAHGDFFTLNGPVAKRAIKSHYFDVAIIGVGGIALEYGLTVDSYLNAEVLQAIIQQSQWIIVLADHRKIGNRGFVQLADLDVADVIITDQPLPEDMRRQLERLNIQVHVVDP